MLYRVILYYASPEKFIRAYRMSQILVQKLEQTQESHCERRHRFGRVKIYKNAQAISTIYRVLTGVIFRGRNVAFWNIQYGVLHVSSAIIHDSIHAHPVYSNACIFNNDSGNDVKCGKKCRGCRTLSIVESKRFSCCAVQAPEHGSKQCCDFEWR